MRKSNLLDYVSRECESQFTIFKADATTASVSIPFYSFEQIFRKLLNGVKDEEELKKWVEYLHILD